MRILADRVGWVYDVGWVGGWVGGYMYDRRNYDDDCTFLAT